MPSLSRGVRVPLLLRSPGTGGRRRGAGDDMVKAGRRSSDVVALMRDG